MPGISGVFRGDGHRITPYRVLGATGVARGALPRLIFSKRGHFGSKLRTRCNGTGIQAAPSFVKRNSEIRKSGNPVRGLS